MSLSNNKAKPFLISSHESRSREPPELSFSNKAHLTEVKHQDEKTSRLNIISR